MKLNFDKQNEGHQYIFKVICIQGTVNLPRQILILNFDRSFNVFTRRCMMGVNPIDITRKYSV